MEVLSKRIRTLQVLIGLQTSPADPRHEVEGCQAGEEQSPTDAGL